MESHKVLGQVFDLRGIENDDPAAADIILKLLNPFTAPVYLPTGNDCLIRIDRLLARLGGHDDVKDVSKDCRNKGLPFAARGFAFPNEARIVRGAEQLAQRAIAAIDLRDLERPVWIISHVPAMCLI